MGIYPSGHPLYMLSSNWNCYYVFVMVNKLSLSVLLLLLLLRLSNPGYIHGESKNMPLNSCLSLSDIDQFLKNSFTGKLGRKFATKSSLVFPISHHMWKMLLHYLVKCLWASLLYALSKTRLTTRVIGSFYRSRVKTKTRQTRPKTLPC